MENKCIYCNEEGAKSRRDLKGCPVLCNDCYMAYEDKTGYCGLSCCITGDCDESC